MTPLVSVIIPTANRPQYLPRAIDSALDGLDSDDVEIIVVPNGPGESWHESLRPYQNNYSVRIIPVREANANNARNTGLTEARGELVRFLDDDDYLVTEGSIRQYELAKTSGADVVSGSVKLVDENGRCLGVWYQPDTDDLCAAVFGPGRNCLPTAHVYRRSSLKAARWNPRTAVRQDVEWLLDLCAAAELKWQKLNDVVGVWQHHWENRTSSGTHFNKIRKVTVPMLIRTHESLHRENRLTEARIEAVALGLWGCIHAAFFLEPIYWSRIARTAQNIHTSARPLQPIYNFPVIRHLNPLLIQWLLIPKRWAFFQIRQLFKRFHIRHNW